MQADGTLPAAERRNYTGVAGPVPARPPARPTAIDTRLNVASTISHPHCLPRHRHAFEPTLLHLDVIL